MSHDQLPKQNFLIKLYMYPRLACENIRFSSLFAAEDVSRETSPAAKSEEKRMFLQVNLQSATKWVEILRSKLGFFTFY